jgi:hypothetical protein
VRPHPWSNLAGPSPLDLPARPLRRIHGDDCHLEHPQCAAARIERARDAAREVLESPHASPGARRTAETLTAILTGRDKTLAGGS